MFVVLEMAKCLFLLSEQEPLLLGDPLNNLIVEKSYQLAYILYT